MTQEGIHGCISGERKHYPTMGTLINQNQTMRDYGQGTTGGPNWNM